MEIPLASSPSLRRAVVTIGTNNEPLGCGPQKVEWIACHQRQSLMACGFQHLNAFRTHDLRGSNSVSELAVSALYLDDIADVDERQHTEEGVSMAGHREIAAFAWKRSTRYVCGTHLKFACAGTLQHNR